MRRLHERGERSAVGATFIDWVEEALGLLDIAKIPRDLDLPGYRLHQLKGDLKGFWSITVSGNWRLVFRFDDGDVCDVDLVDYH